MPQPTVPARPCGHCRLMTTNPHGFCSDECYDKSHDTHGHYLDDGEEYCGGIVDDDSIADDATDCEYDTYTPEDDGRYDDDPCPW